ncbi:hypothetical protein ACHAPA_007957 [Fusarium lateritium]
MFRPGFGHVAPRQNPVFMGHPQLSTLQFHQQQQQQQQLQQQQPQPFRKPVQRTDEASDGDGSAHRIAHTLTACCRCRQRKTRCDPTLPRCLPCERSGSTCEYLDAAKGRKINRYYVIKLQDKVRQLEAELSQFTDDESDYPKSNEDMVRPGGMVRLNGGDETPRYLGPSSGIAMTRLLMEQAKRYTDSKRISDLIPSVRARQARMQSIQMTGPSARRKSYPMISQHPAESLPTRAVADKLLEIFNQKAQLFWPVLHEKDLLQDLDAVYNGDTDSYRLFIIRMLVAISLQKLDTQYAGLADSYYLAAMQLFEDVVRPKDLKTLQCLVLLGQYSLLTPTRMPIYYVIGLAARICQQEGLASEKTIMSYDLDAKTVDMRRRIIWTVAAMEYGLAHSMGRPNNFATGDDRLDVQFFAAVEDENITEQGIQPGPPSERKLVAIHFYKMRMCQAEIRRALYEKKKDEPKHDSHPWFASVEKMNKDWLDASPTSPDWCKPWFTGRYHQMRVFMYRPSPQIPKPSPRAAAICYESSAYIIQLNAKQMESGVDVTWVFLLTVNMSLNTLLWTVSYPEVRQAHSRDEVENLINISMDVLDRCAERWPGSASASQLYSIFSKACLQGYDERPTTGQTTNFFTTPPSFADANSPEAFQNSIQQASYQNPPQFSHVFNSPPEAMNAYAFDPNFPPPQPSFRSNSIFFNPASNEPTGRRFSYFPPDFMQPGETTMDDPTPPATTTPEQYMTSPPDHLSEQLPTPPDSVPTGVLATPTPSNALSPPNAMTAGHPTPVMQHTSPAGITMMPVQSSMSPPIKIEPSQRGPTFAVPPNPHAAPSQRPLPGVPAPGTTNDWFLPPAPFISPYAYNSMSQSFYNDSMANPGNYGDMSNSGLGLQNVQGGNIPPPQFDYGFARQGSLTQSQQLELMNVLETEGMGDIDAFLNGGTIPNNRWY